MGTGKSRKKRDFLSIIMSFIVMIELILSPCEMAFAASENYPNTYTIKVVNSKGEPITGAKVECTVYADAEGRQEVEGLNPEKIATDTNGVVSSAGISKRLEQEEKTYYKITAVSLYGYENYKDTEVQTVDKKNVLSERKITLKEATVNLTGKVVNQADQQPLAGVKVTDGNTSTYTDTDGKYSIGLTFGKEYQITFEVEKFDSVTKTVSLTKENVTCDVKMQKTPVYDPNFKFEKETSKAVIYGENGNVFQNKAETTSTEQTQITYKITSEKNADGEDADVADIDANTGEVKIKTAGEICVEAVRSGDETYDATTISYRLKILKAKQTGVKFKDAVPEDWKTLNGNYKNILVGGESIGKVTYKLSDGENYADINSSTGEVTFKDAGTIEVTATKGGDSCYEAASCTYRITAIREKQEGFKFAATKPSDLIYGEKNTYQNQASGGKGTGAVSYRIIEGNDVADIDAESGEITIKKAGTIKVQAEKKADLYYDGVTAEYTLNILKGSQKPLLFTEVSPEITWNENSNQYTPSVEGGSGDGEVSYQIQKQTDLDGNESDEIANIDETTGIITWKTTGIVTVKAIKSEDDCYNEIETTCTVIMKRAKQNIKFSEKTISLVYGMKEFQQEAKEDFLENATDGTGYGTGKISYSIVEGDKNPLGAEIDETTGTVTFADSKTGTIWVKAVKEADACYESCESKYMITVSWMQTPQNPYTLEGEKFNPEKEWYTGNVKILAPEGYQISSNNAFSEENLWSDEIVYQNEGISDFKIYLREKESGGITDGILISNIRIDKTNPESLQISYKEDSIIKKIGNILFGKNKVTVVLTAKDTVSGIETFAYQYVNNEISTSGQGKDLITVDAEKMTRNEDGSVSYQFDIEPQFRGNVSFKATDYAGRTSELSDAENTVVVDNKSPDVKVSYLPEKGTQLKESVQKDTDGTIKRDTVAVADENTRFIYDGAVKAKIEVKEANLYTDDVVLNIKRDGETIWNGVVTKAEEEEGSYAISEWSVDEESDEAVCEVVLKADGDYEIGIENYADRSKNDMKYDSSEYEGKTGERSYQSNIITIDTTAPEMTVSYDNNDARNGNYYQADRTATIQVKDRNFRPSEVQFTVETEDVQENPVEYETSALNSWTDWKQVEGESDVWQAQIQFDSDARYKAEMSYIDLAGHGLKEDFADEFVVDKEKPDTEGMQISYSEHEKTWQKVLHAVTFGYYTYQTEVEVTLQAEDPISGIDYLNWSYSQEENTSKTNVKEKTGKIETNDLKYSEDGKTAVGTFKLKASEEEQFRGSISFTATDRAGNESDVKADHTRSNIVDNISPEVKVSYAPDGEAKLKAAVEKDTEEQISRGDVADPNESTRFIYDGNVKATIQVQEANFFDKDLILTIVRDNETIWNGAVTEQKEEKGSYAISGWETQGEDTVSCDVILKKDGDYQLYIKYTDSSENKMQYKSEEYADKKGTAEYESNIITVDTVKPEVSVVYDNNDANNGNYYKADRTATIQIKDRNFRPSEVQFAVETEDVQRNPVTHNHSDLTEWTDWQQVEKYVWEAKVPFKTDARYQAEISYTDLAGHNLVKDFSDAFVVDKKKPDASQMDISYSTHIKTWQKVLHAITFGYYSYQEEVEVTLSAKDDISGIDFVTWTYRQEDNTSSVNVKERTKTILRKEIVFSEDGRKATAKFKLTATEKEQFRGSISFTATDMAGNQSNSKDDSGRINIVDTISPTRQVIYPQAKQVVDASSMKTRSDYNYGEGTNSILYYDSAVTVTFKVTEANFYAEDVEIRVNDQKKVPTDWRQDGDTWTGSIRLSGDGDYVVTMNYTDRSSNQMKTYQSEKIVIDTIEPVIHVNYGNTDVKKSVGKRSYFNRTQTAVVSITEHNFRADDVIAKVTAKDVSGADIGIMDYTAYLSNRSHWTKNGDVYSAYITYDVDANYTFDIEYKDLALRKSADYVEDEFTVDKTAPAGLNISFSNDILDQNISGQAYRFYNQMVTVTISGEDNVAGIEHFVYNYKNANGVSGVNEEVLNAAIENAQITKSGSRFTASFSIPRSALGSANQFNGLVDFMAYDYATNSSTLQDSNRIIVDNIAPTATVTYSKPVQEVNGISYYAGSVEAAVEITEANFYAEDVQISATKDGVPTGISANWTDNSTDVHTGHFTLSGDGDYIITINYTDRSTNKMETYTSKQLTIDTEHPTIHVSNVKANSANKDEVYGFTITAEDSADNFTMDQLKTVLTCISRSADGTYQSKEIALENISTRENNQVYVVQVDNLEEDGIYTLSCSAKDLAGNEYGKIMLDDEKEYDSVSFSINRNGSTFQIDQNTENLIGRYYVYDVANDLVIQEINTDPVENYRVKLNDSELKEGTDYTTAVNSPEDQWSVRTYTIKKELFDTEGEYQVVIDSVDKTDTAAYSDLKGLNLSWVVDQTAPVVTVSGLESKGRYKTEEQTVTAIPTDDGGKLKSFKAVVAEQNVEDLAKEGTTLVDLEGEELENYLRENDGKISFNIPEGYEESVQIVCTDYAFHEETKETNTYKEVFTKVTVSPNNMVIFYANKPLLYSTAAIAVIVMAGGVILIIWIRRTRATKEKQKRAK